MILPHLTDPQILINMPSGTISQQAHQYFHVQLDWRVKISPLETKTIYAAQNGHLRQIESFQGSAFLYQ